MGGESRARALRLGLILVLGVILAVSFAVVMVPRWLGVARAALPPVIAALPEFSLVHHDGRRVGLADLAGKPWVADLIFTRCTLSCPQMTARMQALEAPLARAGGARRVSISVDPAHDTPEVMAAYAAAHGVTDPDWLFLTGEPGQARALAVEGFLLGVDESPPAGSPEVVLHSTRFVLVDGEGRIRGYYDAFLAGELERLQAEVAALHREAAGERIR